jgi:hypothetical protein
VQSSFRTAPSRRCSLSWRASSRSTPTAS